MKPTALSPLISGHPASATVSTPGTARRCSATWSQKTGGWGRARDGFQVENPLRRKTGGLTGQPVERGDKQAGDEEHEETEGDLYARSARASCGAANAGLLRLSARWPAGPPRRAAPAPGRTGMSRRKPAPGRMPRRRQSAGRTRRAGLSGGLIMPTTNGARPPCEQSADGGCQERQPGAFHQHQLHQPPSSRADRDAQRHFARPRRRLRRHQVGDVGARNQQHQHHQHAQGQRATGGSLSAGSNVRSRRVPAAASPGRIAPDAVWTCP